MFWETVSVNVAAVDSPGASRVFSLFQVIVIDWSTPDGLQLEVDIPRVNEAPAPVFLM